MNELEKLLYLTGVSTEYTDYHGNRRAVPGEDRLQALREMGYDPDDPASVNRAVFELDAAPWLQWLRPFYIVDQDQPVIHLHSHPQRRAEKLFWEVDTEYGTQVEGSCVPAELPETGEYHIDDCRYSAHALALGELAPGYHQLRISNGSRQETAELIVSPRHCQDIPEGDGQRLWGISCQLYTLRSQRNWGVGDFSDLLQLIELAAARGADLVGLNPLHAALSDEKYAASPYAPSDRRFLNPLYIDPQRMADMDELRTLGRDPLTPDREARCAGLRDLPLVDYDAVNALKYEVFELLYAHFGATHLEAGTPRGRQFQRFLHEQGADLEAFSAFEAVHNRHARRYADSPHFFAYLQWQAQAQLADCHTHALAMGMRIGLMRDLAVGSVPPGCEVQGAPELFVSNATIGAPPDPFADQGQDWGLPALNPVTLRQQQFGHFISLLRSNMSAAGALRIDHAMALSRLWWCLPGSEPGSTGGGLYVYYPRDEMLALLRLESRRNACMVIGEDLGVVPQEFREQMHNGRIYGNRVLYFDEYLDGRLVEPGEKQPDALFMVTNHDVPTLADWWSADDLRRRRQLGLIVNDDALQTQLEGRCRHRERLLEWLAGCSLLPAGRAGDGIDRAFDMELCEALHRAAARGASRLVLLQLEDLQLLREPVNIPGTDREYPNWRRKQQLDTSEVFADPAVQGLLDAVNEERGA
ncbi:4-alpha-glucanotransferase [Seongchinamella unica]|nr:4-alpha-glucanotransferase [Seongchinamella unica]